MVYFLKVYYSYICLIIRKDVLLWSLIIEKLMEITKIKRQLAVLAMLFFLVLQAGAQQQFKPWTKGAFETGRYRNVFVEMGYSQNDVDAKLKEVFNDVFKGENKVYFEVGDSMGYVSDIKNHDARTEGMSYGMMIAVQFGEKDIFDRLWRWSKKYMQH